MPTIRRASSSIQRAGSERARRLRQHVAADVRHAREDAGLSQRRLARAAGVSASTVHALERGTHDPSTEILARLASALGMSLGVRLYPGTGPTIRDHLQAAMISALLGILDMRWRPSPEVSASQPVRGVIDLVLEANDPPVVACEAHSELRRLEQQIRWSKAKAEALAQTRQMPVSRLLLLRSTRRTRQVVAEYRELVDAAFPAPTADIYAAISGTAPWPGDGLLWCRVEGGSAEVMEHPPRGIPIGR